VSAVDTSTCTLHYVVQAGKHPDGISIDEQRDLAFVADSSGNTMRTFELSTGKVLTPQQGKLPHIQGAWATQAVPSRGWVLVMGHSLGITLHVIDYLSGEIVCMFRAQHLFGEGWKQLKGDSVDPTFNPIAVEEEHGILFLICTRRKHLGEWPVVQEHVLAETWLIALDLDQGKVRYRVPIEHVAWHAALDGRRRCIYVVEANVNIVHYSIPRTLGTGFLSIIDAYSGRLQQRVSLGQYPIQCLVNEASGDVYVANRGERTITILTNRSSDQPLRGRPIER
jgi:hypothetical protein